MSEQKFLIETIESLATNRHVKQRLDFFHNFRALEACEKKNAISSEAREKRIDRFERWLQIELLASLYSDHEIKDITPECFYPYDTRRTIPNGIDKFSNAMIDIRYRRPNTDKKYVCIELKVGNRIGGVIRAGIKDLHRITAISDDKLNGIRGIFSVAVYQPDTSSREYKYLDIGKLIQFGPYQAHVIGWEGRPRSDDLATQYRDWYKTLRGRIKR